MANNKLAYGLAKENGIDTAGMTPKEVWDALAENGISVTYPQNTSYTDIMADNYSEEEPKVTKAISLPKQEYAELCSAIRTRYGNKIPKNGEMLYNDSYYRYNYNSKDYKITFIDKMQIEGNEDIIARKGGKNAKRN